MSDQEFLAALRTIHARITALSTQLIEQAKEASHPIDVFWLEECGKTVESSADIVVDVAQENGISPESITASDGTEKLE